MAGIAHPSKKFFLIATITLFLALVLSVIAIITPAWSRVNGTTGITDMQSSLMYTPGEVVTAKSTLYVGQWQWCLYYGDDDSSYTCSKVLLGDDSPPSFGNKKCKGFLYGSRILSILASAFTLVALLVTALTFSKVSAWNAYTWVRPAGPAMGAICTILLAFGLLLTAFIFWIILAEEACRASAVSWNPIQGYSVSFILAVFACGFVLIALIASVLGFLNLSKVPAGQSVPKQDLVDVVYTDEGPMPVAMEQVSYPEQQLSYPVTAPLY